ncbi:alpha/beta fold hydrolase [Saccharopolyspora sp. NPDC002376]
MFLHGTRSHSHIWPNVFPAFEATRHEVLLYDLLGYCASERPLNRDTSEPVFELVLRDGEAHSPPSALAPLRLRYLLRLLAFAHLATDHPRPPGRPGFHASARLRSPANPPTNNDGRQPGPHDRRNPRGPLKSTQDKDRPSILLRTPSPPLKLNSNPKSSAPAQNPNRPNQNHLGAEGRWQPLTYARRLAEDIPNATLATIPDASHFPMEDNPTQIAEELRTLLATR